MADYFTQFSVVLALKDEPAVNQAMTAFHAWAAEQPDGADVVGFIAQPEIEPGQAVYGLWLYADDSGNIEEVIDYVLHLHTLQPRSGRWGFAWAETCSKPRLDGFGGGAVAIDFDQAPPAVEWIDTTRWLGEHTRPSGHD